MYDATGVRLHAGRQAEVSLFVVQNKDKFYNGFYICFIFFF